MKMRQMMRPVFLALGVAAGAAVVAVPLVQAQPMGEMHRMPLDGPMMFGAGPRGDHMVDRWLAGATNVTKAQREQIRKIAKSAMDDLRSQREAGRALHEQMRDLLTQTNVDADAIEALRQKMLAHHDQVSRRMTQAMVEGARVLTPEQRTQIAAKAKARREMMERHMRERRALDGAAAPKD